MTMDLQVGINSYVTVSEADDYVASHYLSTNAARQSWEALTDDDKSAALLRSCMALNNLKYTGRRKNPGQKLEFPRTNTYGVAGVFYQPVFNPAYDQGLAGYSATSSDGLDKAKMAQIENALWYVALDPQVTDGAKITVRGLTSKKAGPIAESYGNTSVQAQEGIYTKQVYAILSEWLSTSRYTV